MSDEYLLKVIEAMIERVIAHIESRPELPQGERLSKDVLERAIFRLSGPEKEGDAPEGVLRGSDLVTDEGDEQPDEDGPA